MKPRHIATALALVALPVVIPAAVGAKPTKPPKVPTGLSIAAKPATVVYGGSTVISGRLNGNNNSARSVTLRHDPFPFGDGFKPLGNATTNAQGNYSFSLKPSVNTVYRTTVASANSTNLLVNVRIRLSLRVSDGTPRVGQSVRFTGRACPAHNGLTVAIQRKSGRRYRTVRRTTLKPSATCSAYSRSLRVRRDGRYRVTADDGDHARGYSRSRFLNAHS